MPGPRLDLDALVDGDLRLRLGVEADVPAITRICRDPDIQRWTRVASPYGEEDARDFVAAQRRSLEDGSGVHLLAVEASSDTLLGAAGLAVDDRDRCAELGFWVAPEARGRGVATRGGRLLCRLAFSRLGLGRVELLAGVENGPSNAVARRLGFVHEGVLRRRMVDGPSGDPTAPRADANVHGLLPDELR